MRVSQRSRQGAQPRWCSSTAKRDTRSSNSGQSMLTRVVGTAGCLSNTRASRRSFVHIVGLDARCSLEVWRRHVREVERLHERVSLADDRGVRGAGLTSRGDVLEPVAARDRHERHAAEVAAEVPQVALRVGQPLVGVLVLREQELRRLVEGVALDCGSVGTGELG